MSVSAKKKFTQSELREIYEVCSRKDLMGDWGKIAEELNKRFGKDYDESCYRKRFQSYCEMKSACKDIDSDFTGNTAEVSVLKRELERAKIQFRDERNAWQRQNYTSARVEQKLDYLEEMIKNSQPQNLDIKLLKHPSNKTAIICASDWHIGECFDNEWGCFNSDIAKQRIEQFASEAIRRCTLEGDLSDVIIVGLGDMISGNIHNSIAVTNRENVIEQIKLASELMLGFVKAFVDKGFNVTFTNVCGNHTRITKKDEAVKDERLDDLIGWFVSTSLSQYVNFKYVPAQDTTFAEVNGFWFAHGDNDSFSKSGLANLVLVKGYKPKAVFMGHLHTFAIDDCYDVKICRGGSLSGSGNDYTIEKRLKGKPTQLMAIAENDVVSQFYSIVLN